MDAKEAAEVGRLRSPRILLQNVANFRQGHKAAVNCQIDAIEPEMNAELQLEYHSTTATMFYNYGNLLREHKHALARYRIADAEERLLFCFQAALFGACAGFIGFALAMWQLLLKVPLDHDAPPSLIDTYLVHAVLCIAFAGQVKNDWQIKIGNASVDPMKKLREIINAELVRFHNGRPLLHEPG